FALRIVDAQLLQAQHRHAYAQDLSRTKVAMGNGSIFQVLFQSLHITERECTRLSSSPSEIKRRGESIARIANSGIDNLVSELTNHQSWQSSVSQLRFLVPSFVRDFRKISCPRLPLQPHLAGDQRHARGSIKR